MYRTEFIIPSVRMRATEENIRKEEKFYSIELEPFAPRHSITYFKNNKTNSRESAYQRLHNIKEFDPKKPRCDRARQSLYWLEISKEDDGHIVPMTANHWYGRPNRIQVDSPETKYNRSSKMQDFYTREKYNPVCEENRQRLSPC